MHDDGSLVTARRVAHAASVAISLKNRFPQTTEVLFILPLQRIAGGAQAKRKHLGVSARAVHGSLTDAVHFPAAAA